MNKVKIIIPALFLSILLITSCEDAFTTVKEINLPEHEKKIAVFSSLNDSICRIFISHSKSIDDNSGYDIVKANVNIYKNDKSFFSFVYPDDLKHGNITNSFIALPKSINEGEKYELEVESSEYGIAKANQIVPDSPEIKDFLYSEGFYIEQYDTLDKLEFTIEDDGEKENFYLFNASLTFFKLTRSKLNLDVSTDDPLVKEFYGNFERGFILSDKTFNGQNKKMILKLQSYSFQYPPDPDEYLDTVELKVKSITKDYYNFLLSQIQYNQSQDNPFAEPVNIYSNIKNGYGLFSAEKSQFKTIKIK